MFQKRNMERSKNNLSIDINKFDDKNKIRANSIINKKALINEEFKDSHESSKKNIGTEFHTASNVTRKPINTIKLPTLRRASQKFGRNQIPISLSSSCRVRMAGPRIAFIEKSDQLV